MPKGFSKLTLLAEPQGKTPKKGGSYGSKILYKNPKFFDKVAVEDFVTLVTGKKVFDGEMFSLGMVSTNLCMLFYGGGIQNSNCRRLEMATYLFLTRG